MAQNKGKQFELKVRSDLGKVPGISSDRLVDAQNGFFGVRNVSDLIFYRYPFICYGEIKSHLGNTFPIANLTQYEKLLAKKGIKGVRAGVILWLINHNHVIWIPIETFEQMKNDNVKSFNIKMLSDNPNNYKFYDIPSTLRRTFMDTDYTKLFEYWEKEFEETGV